MRIATHATFDAGMTIWVGGNLFGIAALNPAASKASLPSDRGAVVNQAWENFIPFGLGSAAAIAAGWAGMRLTDPRLASPELAPFTRVQDIAVASIVALTLVGGVLNRKTAESVPGDRTPMEDGLTPSEGAPAEAKQGLMGLRLVAAGNLIAGATLMTTAAIIEQKLMDASIRSPILALKGAKAIAGAAGDKAMTVAKGLAATELVRRGAKMVGQSWGREPEPRSRWQQLGDQARERFARAA
ncbi:MAG TPA: hypothetical protein PKD53_27285 [Chloroflexaceae bacterium]|nr:hypothetical protein [Chloroflexaceae bacterium]